MSRPAILWKPLDDGHVSCRLCAHNCTLSPGQRGPCFLRYNDGGQLVTDAHSALRVAVRSAVERKPLFHFLPGATTWTLGTAGCNLRCAYCQNASLSQPGAFGDTMVNECSPENVIAQALDTNADAIAFSFSEPSIAYEWVRDVMSAAREANLRIIWVTNGFFSPDLLERLVQDGPPDAANVDLKAANANTWRRVMGARPEPVLETLSGLRQLGTWIEVTTVLIPDMNDSAVERAQMAKWILERLGDETPWHLWRFHPDFRLTDRGPLSTAALMNAATDARVAGLRHVYTGPAGGVPDQVTDCAGCGSYLIERRGYDIVEYRIQDGRCIDCGRQPSGIFLGTRASRPLPWATPTTLMRRRAGETPALPGVQQRRPTPSQ